MKVLITTDGSTCSAAALDEARRLLPLATAEVALVSVTPLPPVGADPVGFGMPLPPDTMPLWQENDEQTKQHLQTAQQALAKAGVTATIFDRLGDPAEEIMDVAREWQPDVIVMGSHGRNAVERFFLGSVSEAVLHHWSGAVLIVRPRVPAKT